MKKLAAILLLSVHLFNLAGYSLLFQYLINHSDAQLVKQLDSNRYNDKDLVVVKVPLNMPYISDSKDFERVNGQIEMNGVHYNYVKRKVSGDTLYVLCVPNVCKTKLYNAKAFFSKEANDIPTNKKSAETIKKASAASEYNSVFNQYLINNNAVVLTIVYQSFNSFLPKAFSLIPEQPPQASC